MRLSDMIKRGSGGGDDSPDKRKRDPEDHGKSQNSAEEEPFRLSELNELRQSKEPSTSTSDAPDDERPIQIPDFSEGLPGKSFSPNSPKDSGPASPGPGTGTSHSSAESSQFSSRPNFRRKSVLMGPDSGPKLDDDPRDKHLVNISDNPYAPLRERAIQFVTSMFQSINQGNAYPLVDAEEIIFACIQETTALDHLYSLAVSAKDTTNSIAVHLFNHTVYALKMGKGLRWAEDRLIRLGVASLIHDLGMCKVPQRIRHKEGKLTRDEIAEIQNHCRYGMETILELYGEPFRWLAEAIYHEHEREDGGGYPQGLMGNQISEYAKVIGLADVYEALTHNRPHRKRLLPHKAVQEIVQTQKTQFHQKLLKVMLEELSVFSLNSLVRLNSNAIGRVVETLPGQPLRPIIRLLFDADGNEIMDERLIALREFPLLYIVDEVEESELPFSM